MRPLPLVLALFGAFALACMPPTTYGLRTAGELSEPGTGGVGGGAGISSTGFTVFSIDGDYSLNDHVGVAAAMGLVGGAVQAQ